MTHHRQHDRAHDRLREIRFDADFTQHAEGSVLVSFGQTRVLCNASFSDCVPKFLKGSGQGWVTAEYGMLPRSTHERMKREASAGKQSGRTIEIQRLIGRSLRAAVDLKALGENTITVDCDVIQADGGTRTAAITGGCLALAMALNRLHRKGICKKNPLQQLIGSVSVGIVGGTPLLDLDYKEDFRADTDMNVVMSETQQFIELQGTAEKNTFSNDELQTMLSLAQTGITALIEQQKTVLREHA